MTRPTLCYVLAWALSVPPICAAQDTLPARSLRRMMPGAVAHATLPQSGTPLPSLRFATLSGDTLDATWFGGQRVVMLLWAEHCGGRARLEASADSLVEAARSFDARVLVVSLDPLDRVYGTSLPTRVQKADILVALTPAATFVDSAEMAEYVPGTPAAIRVPAIILLDADGRVRYASAFQDREDAVGRLSLYWGR